MAYLALFALVYSQLEQVRIPLSIADIGVVTLLILYLVNIFQVSCLLSLVYVPEL